ncbi:hypothetical protein K0M31_003916 [Melipona bicolor]|uniref:Uncharacterized protein n=1 Tax=Melipona bicolor TaxID=60889 RepID=A0AA40FYL7_9HYME|nr:hypothetical protein K0M31_003916 [Melipona bicolor]
MAKRMGMYGQDTRTGWLWLAVPLGWLLLDESTGAEDLMEDIGTGPPARRLIRTLENR